VATVSKVMLLRLILTSAKRVSKDEGGHVFIALEA